MLIEFKKVKVRNFLSYGDNQDINTLEYDIANMTLIGGRNGAGKSSLVVEAITFALYGKPFRKISKKQLMNSVNNTGGEVWLWFEIAGVSYMVYRSIKPKKFKIYRRAESGVREFDEPEKMENGEMDYKDMLPPLSDKEYQIKLDEITKCSFAAFKQLIVLGSANHESFMELDASKRREIITQILDIEIFTEMSEVLKGLTKQNTTLLGESETNLRMKQNEVEIREGALEKLRQAQNTSELDEQLKKEKTNFKRIFGEVESAEEAVKTAEAKVGEAEANVAVAEEEAQKAVVEAESRVSVSEEEAKVKITEAEDKVAKVEEMGKAKLIEVKEKVKGAKLIVEESESKVKREESSVEAEEAIVAEHEKKVEQAQAKVDEVISKLDNYDAESLKAESDKVKEERTVLEASLKRDKKSAKFYFTNDDCESCGQIIHADFKKETLSNLKKAIEDGEARINDYDDNLKALEKKFNEISEIREEVNQAKQGVTEAKDDLSKAKEELSKAKTKLSEAKQQVENDKQGVVNAESRVESFESEMETAKQNAQQQVENAKSGVEAAKERALQAVENAKDAVKTAKASALLQVDTAKQGVENAKNVVNVCKESLKSSKSSIENIESLIEAAKNKGSEEVIAAEAELKVIKEEYDAISTEHDALNKEKQVHDIVRMLLKDNGIKAQVISQWLPTLNHEINLVLERLNADYAFTLNENFDETILSRFRDNFSYASFSEGEKARISTSILFAFRQVAMQKATVSTNILVLDEIGAELDVDSHEIMLQMLKETKGLSTFIITHKNTDTDIYDRVLEVQKEGNFSIMRDAK